MFQCPSCKREFFDDGVCQDCAEKIQQEAGVRACLFCKMPESVNRLIRIAKPNLSDKTRPRLMVAKQPKSTDKLICEKCIRQIKRIPFSDFEETEPPF